MRKMYMSSLVCGAIFLASPVLVVSADQPEAPKEPVSIVGSKKTVLFPHDKGHEKYECVVCHHPVDGKTTYAKCATAGCHDNLVEKKGDKSLYFVMHNKSEDLKFQSCMKCHADIVAKNADLKKKLTGCSQSACHPGDKKTDEAQKS